MVLIVIMAFFIGYFVVLKAMAGRSRGKAHKEPLEPARIADPQKEAVPRWHDILGVPEEAPMSDIVSAYHRQIDLYHPDKVAHLGPELKAVAENKTKAIQAAYDYICSIKSARSP